MNFLSKQQAKNIFSAGLIALSLLVVFSPSVSHAQTTNQSGGGSGLTAGSVLSAANSATTLGATANVVQNVVPQSLQDIGLGAVIKLITLPLYFIEMLIAMILGLSGYILNYVINLSVIDMAKNVTGITGINIAWTLIRDLINMSFIFILVYHAIMMIFGKGDARKIIAPIIIAAILINFSLFFTKLIIDASNIVTVSFYNSIAQVGSSGTATVSAVNQLSATGATASTTISSFGFSDAFMKPLNLTSLYGSDTVTGSFAAVGQNPGPYMISVVGGSLFMLAAAFVFLAMAVMFIIRYLAFIFLLIISPLGYMASVVPGLKGISNKYWDTLIGQALFAPIFMIMCWITLTLVGSAGFLTAATNGASMGKAFTNPDPGSIGLIVNFFLLIGLMIYTLIVSKSYATKGGLVTSKMIDKGGAMMGGAVFGSTAFIGRSTFGRGGKALSENASLQEAAAKKTGIAGAGARLALYASKKAQKGSFDARNMTLPTNVYGDVVEGTLGRTKAGKALGLNDVNIPSVGVGAYAAGEAGLGAGGTKGYKETKEESNKRVRDREALAASELTLAQAKKAVIEGAQPTATTAQIDAMEKALAKLSDKETEALVASNRKLLDSQNFANSISVKQLEAINKSDQFSESEKGRLKDTRFAEIKAIDDAVGIAALAKIAAGIPTTTAENDAADLVKKAQGKVKGLSDSEIEMIDTTYLSKPEFISQMRGAQFESIAKSNKFTSSQKKTLKDMRVAPLITAVDTSKTGYAPNAILVKDMISKTLAPEDVAGLMSTKIDFVNHTGPVAQGSILTHPDVIDAYTPSILKRMAQKMSGGDIQTVRTAIEDKIAHTIMTPGSSLDKVDKWLKGPNGSDFS